MFGTNEDPFPQRVLKKAEKQHLDSNQASCCLSPLNRHLHENIFHFFVADAGDLQILHNAALFPEVVSERVKRPPLMLFGI